VGKTVESSGSNVQIGVCGGENEDQDTGVQDTWQCLDTGKLDGDDEWGCGGGVGALIGLLQVWGVVWDKHSEEENQNDVEEKDSVEGELDGAGDDLSWVGGFSDSYTYQFGS